MKAVHAGSLSRRMATWLALLALAGLIVTCVGIYAATALSFTARQDDAVRQKQLQIRHLVAEVAAPDGAELRHKLDDAMVGHPAMALSLTDDGGRPLYGGPALPPRGDHVVAAFEMPASSGTIHAALTLDVSEDARVLTRLAQTLLAASVLGAAMITIAGYSLLQVGLRPVHDLVDQVQHLGANTLHRRLDGSAQPSELAPLVERVNELLGRLDQAYLQLEAFNADVAHELFTPLATLRNGAELALRKSRDVDALREVLGAQLEDLERMSLIVQDMLFLSQADRGAQARRESVPSLAHVAAAVAELHEASIEAAGLQWRMDGDTSCEADVRLLQRALSNLIGNATRYAVVGSVLTVRVERSSSDISLCVSNCGDTIAAEHLPRLFDRFYRVDAARAGADRHHGLGLAIVHAIARMHGGRVFATSEDGVTTIGMTLPARLDTRPS